MFGNQFPILLVLIFLFYLDKITENNQRILITPWSAFHESKEFLEAAGEKIVIIIVIINLIKIKYKFIDQTIYS